MRTGFAALLTLLTIGCSSPASSPSVMQLERVQRGALDWWVPYPQWSLRHEVEAYTDRLSYAAGERVTVMLSTSTANDDVTWRLLRTGWYGGRGARDVAGGSVVGNPQPLPHAGAVPARCAWTPSFTIDLPARAVSGIYALRLDSAATGKSTFVTLTVRDGRAADIVFVRADFTDEAYNSWDGDANDASAYNGAAWVSFDRPLRSVAGEGVYSWSSGYFVYEYSWVRWLEQQGYDVSYVSDVDLHDGNAHLERAQSLVVAGHDEYWTAQMRDRVEAARDKGLHLGFFGSDLVDGEIRFAPGDARTFTRNISDRDLRKNEWADKPLRPRRPPHDNPSDTLTGEHYLDWCGATHPNCLYEPEGKLRLADDYQILAPAHPIFRGVTGEWLRDVVGYEYETVRSDRAGIRSLRILARATVSPHDTAPLMVAYVAPSGAKVVNLGSMHWGHALDDWAGRALMRTSGGARECRAGEADCFVRAPSAAAQVTGNVLADFGVFPVGTDAQLVTYEWPRE